MKKWLMFFGVMSLLARVEQSQLSENGIFIQGNLDKGMTFRDLSFITDRQNLQEIRVAEFHDLEQTFYDIKAANSLDQLESFIMYLSDVNAAVLIREIKSQVEKSKENDILSQEAQKIISSYSNLFWDALTFWMQLITNGNDELKNDYQKFQTDIFVENRDIEIQTLINSLICEECLLGENNILRSFSEYDLLTEYKNTMNMLTAQLQNVLFSRIGEKIKEGFGNGFSFVFDFFSFLNADYVLSNYSIENASQYFLSNLKGYDFSNVSEIFLMFSNNIKNYRNSLDELEKLIFQMSDMNFYLILFYLEDNQECNQKDVVDVVYSKCKEFFELYTQAIKYWLQLHIKDKKSCDVIFNKFDCTRYWIFSQIILYLN